MHIQAVRSNFVLYNILRVAIQVVLSFIEQLLDTYSHIYVMQIIRNTIYVFKCIERLFYVKGEERMLPLLTA